ncbi:hypothetical protein IEZ26_21515 [Nocardioides cavernae]|uniref:Uncharacterized protein n=1 Tax=Nocardioides cavernae TaxID=1921566 RepID=A0ABR8NGG0_9ACTN|nr:hypothetical protein [Nocardioides cavernae]MBD3927215.1 hypothetical protein [Nocardioides cavernae]MBM7512937.1 hypothetical protein [Nocardioides cavernae]
MNTWQTRRPLWWGLLLLMDREASDVPALTADVVSFSRTGLAVKVLHAQDVDLSGYGGDDVSPPAQVQIEVIFGDGAPESPASSGVIDVPSGVLTVGDAELQDTVEIGPGRWAAQVECTPRENAEKVCVWLQAV